MLISPQCPLVFAPLHGWGDGEAMQSLKEDVCLFVAD